MICYINENIKFLSEHRKQSPIRISNAIGLTAKRITSFINKKNTPNAMECMLFAEYFNIPVGTLLSLNLKKHNELINSFDFRFLVLDIDGVMTDGGMYYTESGDEFKKFNAKDGLAIIRLINEGKKVGFLSSGINKNIIQNRAKLLGIQHFYVGAWKKLEVLESWCKELNISLKNVAYIGDDLNDLAIIEKVGLSACPNDAIAEVKEKVNFVLSLQGGKACVREFIDLFL
ncbi:MAG: HAD-IIIA family hydrolase [Bacteroidota bacterium]